MYAKYVYTSSATMEQIHDDVFEIFCGETDVNNLSASCDTGGSDIITTYSTSPWVDFDDVSSTERIMRLESSDDTGVYKYVGWHHNNQSNGSCAFAVMESWDAGTDTPTNEYISAGSPGGGHENIGTFATTVGGCIHIYSSTYCTIVMPQTDGDLYGNNTGGGNYPSIGIFECDRTNPALALGDMPNWFLGNVGQVWSDTDNNMDSTFWQGRDETDTVITPFRAEMCYPGRDTQYSLSNSYSTTGALGSATALTDIGAATSYGLEPIFVSGSVPIVAQDATTYYGNVSTRCDIWMLPVGSVDVASLVKVGGNTYIVFKTGYNGATTGTVVGGKFIVPYG